MKSQISTSSIKKAARKIVFGKECYLPLVFASLLMAMIQYLFFVLPDVFPIYSYGFYSFISGISMLIGAVVTFPLSFGVVKYILMTIKGREPAPNVILSYYTSSKKLLAVLGCLIWNILKHFLTTLVLLLIIVIISVVEYMIIGDASAEAVGVFASVPFIIAGFALALYLYYFSRWSLELTIAGAAMADGASAPAAKYFAEQLVKGKTTGYIKLILSFAAAVLLLPLITFGSASYIYVLPVFTTATSIYAIKIYIDSGDGCKNG